MNVWECDHPGCRYSITGCGGAVGVRAVGWYVQFGGRGNGGGPLIFCPRHRPDTAPCQDRDDMAPCAVCAGERAAEVIQEMLYTDEDRATLRTLGAGVNGE